MIFDMPSCGGCRTCELACSFHHLGEFVPAVSSLKILEKTDGVGYQVLLKEQADQVGLACDGCDGEEVPWCMEYCREMDDLYKLLQQFKASRTTASLQEGAQRA